MAVFVPEFIKVLGSMDAARYEYVRECMNNVPAAIPEPNFDDWQEEDRLWHEYFEAETEWQKLCYYRAVEKGLYPDGDFQTFLKEWDAVRIEASVAYC